MDIKKAYKFRLKTNSEIAHKLRLFAGHARFVWNHFYFLNKSRLEKRQKLIYSNEASFWLTLLKKTEELSFLNEAPSQILQQKLKDLERGYKDGFDKKQPLKRMPTRKKKTDRHSFRYPDANQFRLENRRIFLPKLGYISFFKSREIVGTPKNITISYNGGHWYASIQVEQKITIPVQKKSKENAVGIDMGISQFVPMSTTTEDRFISPKNSYRVFQEKLSLLQKKVSRKKRFSNNWRKSNLKVTKLHSRIANVRRDHLHKISQEISKNHAEIFVEDLQVKNMSKSASGTLEVPGKNVAAKSGLNKSILDQGWCEFRRQLKYKSA